MAHKMSFSSDDEIRHIAQGLIDRTLPRNEWTHAAHFAAAAWLLSDKQHNAFLEMPGFIRDYNEDRVSIILNILKPKNKAN